MEDTVQPDETLTGTHPAEPAPGSFRAAAGGEADLFNLDHYPVSAICRICRAPIWAEAFLRPFSHELEPRLLGHERQALAGERGRQRHRSLAVANLSLRPQQHRPAGCGGML
jgi:hypothetical protein